MSFILSPREANYNECFLLFLGAIIIFYRVILKTMSKTTKQYCVFFEGLTPELNKSVIEICKNAPDKSKIYSNFIKDTNLIVNVLSNDGDLIRLSMISNEFKRHVEYEINNIKNQKNDLDEILDLYKSSKKWRKNVNNDYFFKRLFHNCIESDNYNEIDPDDENELYDEIEPYDDINPDDDIEQYLGGKSKRNKSKRNKHKGKRKTCRK